MPKLVQSPGANSQWRGSRQTGAIEADWVREIRKVCPSSSSSNGAAFQKKRNGRVLDGRRCLRISLTQSASMGRAPGPLSPTRPDQFVSLIIGDAMPKEIKAIPLGCISFLFALLRGPVPILCYHVTVRVWAFGIKGLNGQVITAPLKHIEKQWFEIVCSVFRDHLTASSLEK
ncbi:MAG: hypothetical protein ACRD1R_18015 [Acidobacteriota bacterium]